MARVESLFRELYGAAVGRAGRVTQCFRLDGVRPVCGGEVGRLRRFVLRRRWCEYYVVGGGGVLGNLSRSRCRRPFSRGTLDTLRDAPNISLINGFVAGRAVRGVCAMRCAKDGLGMADRGCPGVCRCLRCTYRVLSLPGIPRLCVR